MPDTNTADSAAASATATVTFDRSLKTLDLSNSDALNSPEDVAALAEMLATNNTLEELILGDRMTDQIAIAIAPALEHNTELKRLEFDITTRNWTDFSADGMDAFNDMLSSGNNITLCEVKVPEALDLNVEAKAALACNLRLRNLLTSANEALAKTQQASDSVCIFAEETPGEHLAMLTDVISSLTRELDALSKKQTDALSEKEIYLNTLRNLLKDHRPDLLDNEQRSIEIRIGTTIKEIEFLGKAHDKIEHELKTAIDDCSERKAELVQSERGAQDPDDNTDNIEDADASTTESDTVARPAASGTATPWCLLWRKIANKVASPAAANHRTDYISLAEMQQSH